MFTREIKVEKAWIKEPPDRGQHCAELRFLLKGPKATLILGIYTGWLINQRDKQYLVNDANYPSIPAWVEYHSKRSVKEGDTLRDSCEFLDGKPCYHDSLCCSTELFNHLTEHGSDGLFEEMERLYHQLFDQEPAWLVEPYEQMARAVARVS